eukprot:5690770-Amphidinium_carterae.1
MYFANLYSAVLSSEAPVRHQRYLHPSLPPYCRRLEFTQSLRKDVVKVRCSRKVLRIEGIALDTCMVVGVCC